MRTAHKFKLRIGEGVYPSGTIGELVARGWAGEFNWDGFTRLAGPAGISREGVGPLGLTGGIIVAQAYSRGPLVWDRGRAHMRIDHTVSNPLAELQTISNALAALRESRAREGQEGVLATGRIRKFAQRDRLLEEGEMLDGAPIPSGYSVVTGVEVEYYPRMGGAAEVTRAMFWAGLAGAVSVTTDGSLRREGVELRVMATRENLDRVVRKALAIAPGRVDDSCGLHVHLDMRHRDVDLVWGNLLAMEGVICRSQPRDRIDPEDGGGYCRMLEASEKSLGTTARDRYRAINAAALVKGTIEVRAHTGSSNPNKILAWCEFLNAIADLGVALTPGVTAEETLTRFEGIVGREFPYVRNRMARFAEGWADPEVEAEAGCGDQGEGDPDAEPIPGCVCRECVRIRAGGMDHE